MTTHPPRLNTLLRRLEKTREASFVLDKRITNTLADSWKAHPEWIAACLPVLEGPLNTTEAMCVRQLWTALLEDEDNTRRTANGTQFLAVLGRRASQPDGALGLGAEREELDGRARQLEPHLLLRAWPLVLARLSQEADGGKRQAALIRRQAGHLIGARPRNRNHLDALGMVLDSIDPNHPVHEVGTSGTSVVEHWFLSYYEERQSDWLQDAANILACMVDHGVDLARTGSGSRPGGAMQMAAGITENGDPSGEAFIFLLMEAGVSWSSIDPERQPQAWAVVERHPIYRQPRLDAVRRDNRNDTPKATGPKRKL